MCANYHPATSARFQQNFERLPPGIDWKPESFPGYSAPIVTNEAREDGVLATFGMLPHWAKPALVRSTYNARSETAADKPSFRNAWRKGQFCIIPADVIYEPHYPSAEERPLRWAIRDADGRPLGIAGLWEVRTEDGAPHYSFSMLTINADLHPIFSRMHKPGDEKRMVVVLDPDDYGEWLHAKPENAFQWLRQYPGERLTAEPAPREKPKAPNLF
jgi:putative SOS response-associated peptidase YedK